MNHPVIPATFLLQNHSAVIRENDAQRSESVAARVRTAWQNLGNRAPAASRADLAA